MKKGEGPYRTCVGCRKPRPKQELLRLVSDRHMNLVIDREQKKPGRGAYLCPDLECAKRAVKRNTFAHALRRPLKISPEFLKELAEAI